MYSFIGGLKVCHEMRRRRLELRPSEPQGLQGLQTLPRTWDQDFVRESTRGKPRVASHEAVEDEDEVEADAFDAVVGEG